MFYRCNKCGKFLTEFDINFTKNLNGSFDKKSCKCANCLAKTDYLSNIKKPNFFIYFSPYLIIVFIVLFIKVMIPYGITLGIILEYSFTPFFVSCIICAIFAIRDFKSLKDESYDTSCIRTTYDSSSNSFVTSSSTTTVGDDHFGEKMLLFFTYPVWAIFVYLYRIIKYHRDLNKNYTKEVRLSYNKAIKETEKFILPNKFAYPHNIQQMFQLKMEKYEKLKQQIISKYKYLGENQVKVKIQIKKLKKPTITIRSNQTVYKLLFNMDNISFVINKSGTKKVLFNNYAIYSEDKKHIIDLFDVVNENIENNKELSYNDFLKKIQHHNLSNKNSV